MSEKIYEYLAVIATIDPDAYTAATYVTDEIDMQDWDSVLFVVMAGTLGTSATLDFVVNGGATSNAGSHATAVTGTTITQLTQAGSDSDKQVLVEVTNEAVAAQSLRFIEGSMAIGTATSDAGAVVLGVPRNYRNANQFDLASVDEIKAP